jgi:hypothetical protein
MSIILRNLGTIFSYVVFIFFDFSENSSLVVVSLTLSQIIICKLKGVKLSKHELAASLLLTILGASYLIHRSPLLSESFRYYFMFLGMIIAIVIPLHLLSLAFFAFKKFLQRKSSDQKK